MLPRHHSRVRLCVPRKLSWGQSVLEGRTKVLDCHRHRTQVIRGMGGNGAPCVTLSVGVSAAHHE